MSEQTRYRGARGYQMRKRASDIAATRQRIVEAAVRLHGTIGPTATTISALAEEAGVTPADRLPAFSRRPDAIHSLQCALGRIGTSPPRTGNRAQSHSPCLTAAPG